MIRPARNPDHQIDPLFHDRWSRRAFAADPIDETQLQSLFEAARWAPSAKNVQPWRFVYAVRGDAEWPLFTDLLFERNRVWAEHAGALIAILSHTVREDGGAVGPWRSHAFDAGAAWGHLALQAHRLGLNVRAMGGFDRARAHVALGAPEAFDIQVIVAVGHPGQAQDLPDHLRDLEQPTGRRPINALAMRGRFLP